MPAAGSTGGGEERLRQRHRRRSLGGGGEKRKGRRRRRGIPPTKLVMERFWGLGCSQETVVAPSQASHRAALGHPVIDRQTHQMARSGQLTRICLFFIHGCWVGVLLFIRPRVCHVSVSTCWNVNTSVSVYVYSYSVRCGGQKIKRRAEKPPTLKAGLDCIMGQSPAVPAC